MQVAFCKAYVYHSGLEAKGEQVSLKKLFQRRPKTKKKGVILPWIRVAVEKPTAGPGVAKEEGRRGRLWSPWTSLSGTAPIRINIQNLDVGFHWFISDRSREITHSLLCNLLSGRSPWVFQCTALYCWLVLHVYRWQN